MDDIKTPQHSTKKGEPRKARVPRPIPLFKDYDGEMTETNFDTLCYHYQLWGEREEVLMIEEFLDEQCIADKTFDEWLRVSEKLARVHQKQLRKLMIKREKALLQATMRERPVMYTLHNYSVRWKQVDEYWAKLKNTEDSKKDTNINVHMHPLKSEEE